MPDCAGATVMDDLPEWLVVDDILVRLPAKDVLRCRAVRKSWRTGTTTDAFILAHHRRQPSLPVVEVPKDICCVAVAGHSGDRKLRPVIRYPAPPVTAIEDTRFLTCDGLVILQHLTHSYICNPATRKWASLPLPPWRALELEGYYCGIDVIGFYRHRPSGEHRALWVSYSIEDLNSVPKLVLPDYFVLTVGSDQPRCIQWPTVSTDGFPAILLNHIPPVHHRDNLHWLADSNMITAFDTVTETCRQMSYPTEVGPHVGRALMDMGGSVALSRTSLDRVMLDVWVLQNYDKEIWSCRYRINLSAMPLLDIQYTVPRMAVINEHELLIGQDYDLLVHCDTDGVVVGNAESEEHEDQNHLKLTNHRFQESMISLPLFEAQEENAVNMEPSFWIVL